MLGNEAFLRPSVRIVGQFVDQLYDALVAQQSRRVVAPLPGIGYDLGLGDRDRTRQHQRGNSDRGAKAAARYQANRSSIHRTPHPSSPTVPPAVYRSPSCPLISCFCRPPMRGAGRPLSVTATATRISSLRGASGSRTSMASKWLRTKAASLWPSGTSIGVPRPANF